MPRNELIQTRRGTAAAWTAANPVLSSGEPGFETDTGNIKVGDGVTAWNSLKYALSGTYAPLANPALTGTPTINGLAAATASLATGAPVTRLRAAAIGDSTTAGGLRSVDATVVQIGNSWAAMDAVGIQQAGPQSWFTHACLQSGGRLLPVYNAGIHSDTTTGMLARFQTDVVAKSPDVVFIGDAHNDFSSGSGISLSTTRSNIIAMITAAQAAGIMPILRTCYPENNQIYNEAILAHNAWLKQYAAKHKLIVVDTYAAVVDNTSTSGAWQSSLNNAGDGTHASYSGGIAAGSRVLADLAGLLRGNSAAPPWLPTSRVGGYGRQVADGVLNSTTTITSSTAAFSSTYDVGRPVTGTGIPAGTYIASVTNGTTAVLTQAATASASGVTLVIGPHTNLLYNPLMQDDINADGKADFWTVNGAGVTPTLVTDSSVLGKAQQMVIASSTLGNYQGINVDNINLSVGDRIKWVGMFKVTGASGSLNFDLTLQFLSAASYVVKPIGQTVGVDYPWSYFEVDAVVPSGATTLRSGPITYAGTGTIWMAQQGLYNLTKLGF